MKLRVLLGFPFRGEGVRRSVFDRVRPSVEGLYDFKYTFVYDSEHTPFNRAATRNGIAGYADICGYDVVVICDADSIPEEGPLTEAITACYNKGGLHIRFDKVRVMPARYAKSPPDRYQRKKPLYTYGPSCGGVFVIRPSEWVLAGGMDERIVGWGYEDEIFLVSVKTFLGKPTHYSGDLINFQHPRGGELDFTAHNTQLRDSYNQNVGNKTKIREIQRGSNLFTPRIDNFCPHEGQTGQLS